MDRGKIFFRNAVVLCLTSVLLRGVGVAFNSFISQKLGAEGLGLFSLINSVYSFGVTFALSGINLASSRLTAEAIGSGHGDRIRPIMLRCGLYGLFFGSAACLGLIALTPIICESVICDIRAESPLFILALSLPPLSVISAFTGYFNAVRRAAKSASVQILEQFIRIAVTVTLLFSFVGDIELACFYIGLAVTISESVVFVYGFIMYRIDVKHHGTSHGKTDKAVNSAITAGLLNIALPVAFSSYIRSGLITLQHMLIPRGLRRSGASSERALAGYGTLHGMALPVVLFPQAFLSAFAGLLVPEVAEARVKGDTALIKSMIARVFRITLWLAVGVSGLMLSFSYELGTLLYDSTEAGAYIRLLAPLIPVMYIDTSVDSILKGMNEQLYSMRVNIIDAFMSVVLVVLLIPEFGVKGYLITIYVTETLNTTMSMTRLLKICDIRPKLFDWLILPMLCVVGACSLTRLFIGISGIIFRYDMTELIFELVISSLLYIVMLFITGSLKHSDIKQLKRMIKETPHID